MDGGYGALSSSEKARGKEKVETKEASKSINTVEGEDNSSAAGGPSPGDIGANASQGDEATNVLAKEMLKKIDDLEKKGHNFTKIQKKQNTASKKKLPGSTEDHVKKLCEPRAVAIGPYHRKTEDDNFHITDKHKLWCVKFIIGNNYKQDLSKFLGKMKEREEGALKFYRNRYGIDYPGMDSQSFLEMLMLDSCFILFALEFLISRPGREFSMRALSAGHPRDMVRARELIKTDLLLLDNQIPFSVLEDVFKMKNYIDPKEKMQNGGNNGNDPIRKTALKFFGTLGLGRNSSKGTETVEVDHLLHLYYLSLDPDSPEPNSVSTSEVRLNITSGSQSSQEKEKLRIPSATDLQRMSAVKFKVKKTKEDPSGKSMPQSALNVTCERGEIQMPELQVNDYTALLLHNLIVFEKTRGIPHDPYVTAYVTFMYRIVQKSADVELLTKSRVLENSLTSPRVVTLFRQLHNVIGKSKTPGYLAKVYKEAMDCYDSNWRKVFADAKRRYCSNVWVSVTFVAGMVISVLTLIQTYYTVIGFYQS